MKWEYDTEHFGWFCSKCGFDMEDIFEQMDSSPDEWGYRYCPHCGDKCNGHEICEVEE